MSTRGSAGGFGARPFSSRLASTKASIGLATQFFAHGRELRVADRLKGPVVTVFVGDGEIAARRSRGFAVFLGPGGAHLHPLDERLDLAWLELAGRRHLEPTIVDRLDHGAGVGIAGHDGRSRIAAFEHRIARVEPQASLMRGNAVALEACAGEHGADFRFEEFDLICGKLRASGGSVSGQPA